MTTDFEKLNKEEIEGKIKTLESDLAYGEDIKENERVYKHLLEKSDPEKHKLNIKRAQQKLEDIENIKKLRARLEVIAGAKIPEQKVPEVKKPEQKIETLSFDAKYIEEKVRGLLESQEAIKKINELKIEGKGNQISLKLDFEGEGSKKIMGIDTSVKVKAVITTALINKSNTLAVERPNIEASFTDRKLINMFLTPELGKVAERLKDFIEKEKDITIENIWIEDSQLKVSYKGEIEELEETAPEEKTEETSSFFANKGAAFLNQAYAHYLSIIENEDNKSTAEEIKNAKIQMGFIDAEIEKRNKAKEEAENKPEEPVAGTPEETTTEKPEKSEKKEFLPTPEWQSFKANELRSLSPEADAELIELLNNNPIEYLDHMIANMSGHIEGLVNKETKWPDTHEFEAVDTLESIKNGLLELNKEEIKKQEEIPPKNETNQEGELKEKFDLKTDQEKLDEINKNISNAFGENESETTEGIEGEPLPDFVWTKDALTKKEDGIDAEVEEGIASFEIGGKSFEIIVSEDCWVSGEKPGRVRKLFGAKQKKIKLEKSYWDVYISTPAGEHENEIQEFEEKYPDKFNEFQNKDDALAYANEMKVAMAKLKRKIERDLAEKKASIELDKKGRPLLYYGWEKSKNKFIPKNLYENKLLKINDLTKAGEDMQFSLLQSTGENEGFFDFNLYGFTKIIKNVKEVKTEKGINPYSEDAIYKIVGPNNEILADDIKGFSQMIKDHGQLLEKYKEDLQKELERENVLA